MNTPHNLLIIGASARAAAASALRAGLAPRCVDFFADRDLASLCPVERVEWDHSAGDLERTARGSHGDAWIFTGPLENHPEVVARISRSIPLMGTGPEALRAIRDPLRLAKVLRENGLEVPDACFSPAGLPRDGSWLVKPVASGGGRLVRVLDNHCEWIQEPNYFQRRLDGPCFSALFIANRGSAELVGVTKQLVGAPRDPFGYRGSIGPCQTSEDLSERLRRIGRTLASSFRLAGWFGVDYVLHGDRPWPVEVNPRYVASIEVYEHATGRQLMLDHLRACGLTSDEQLTTSRRMATDGPPVVGKAILYAHRDFVFPDTPVPDQLKLDPFVIPELADVPWPGTRIEPGQAVLTVLTSGADVADCEDRLRSLEESWRRRLEP